MRCGWIRGGCTPAPTSQPDMTLAQAQEAKLDLICRKLQLRPGERFLDIGSGWGGLLMWAAEHYGVDATGITLSRNQQAHVQQLIAQRGLQAGCAWNCATTGTCRPTCQFDKIASVGMFEHVGRANWARTFQHHRPTAGTRGPGAQPRHHLQRRRRQCAGLRHGGVHREVHLPRRRAAAREPVAARNCAGRAGDGGHREPAAALCADAVGLVRRAGIAVWMQRAGRWPPAGSGAGRAHPAGLPAVPRRQRHELRAGLDCAAPDAGHPAVFPGRRAHNRPTRSTAATCTPESAPCSIPSSPRLPPT
jgi:hypothetical protein